MTGMWSEFGQRMTAHSGIGELMHDLGRAMAGHADMLMLGEGNPAGIPAMQEIWRQDMAALLEDAERFDRIICHYDTPQGNARFLVAVAKLFREQYGWDVGPHNVAVTNSSQNAAFMLLNMLAGQCKDGSHKKILWSRRSVVPRERVHPHQRLAAGHHRSRRPAYRGR